jgi:GTPase SAR1 family protein
MQSNVSLSDGQKNLQRVLKELGAEVVDWNEANTRFHLIDRLLVECLGWPRVPNTFDLERYVNGDYRDYVLGDPAAVIWEAKRSGLYFDFPADADKAICQNIEDIFAVSKSAEAAIKQVQRYCVDSGVEIAVVCNGYQLIAFVAVRIGQPWLKGKALIIRTLQQMTVEFATVWQCLSPDGVYEKRIHSLLNYGSTRAIPGKLSGKLIHYPSFRYKSELQANLRTLAELLLEDVVSSDAVRPQFYRECYCDTSELSRDSLVSEQILKARYAALFARSDDAPLLQPAAPAGAVPSLSTQVATESLSRRPIVLLGDAGVGKTSFLENLMEVRAPEEFARALHIYIDLGSNAALAFDIRRFVIDDIERQLMKNYGVDIYEHHFVRGVYDLEVKRFRQSFKAAIYKSNKAKLDDQLMERLNEFVNDKASHLRSSIQHVARARKRQIIIMLDNADQRSLDVQQSAFIIAQEMARNWDALVFISVRPQTFFQSKRAGALSAYPHKIFTILPPRPELVIEKRLIFALKIAEGRISSEILYGVKVNLRTIAGFIRVLLHSIKVSGDLREILSNITAGNIRAVVEFITNFIGSPNVEAEKIVDLDSRGKQYVIPIHEFSKAAILGDYSHYVPNTSLAMNLFDVQASDRKEHFLCAMIITFMAAAYTAKDRDGFIAANRIIHEMQGWGFIPEQIKNALRRLTNKRLIETTQRVTFEEDLVGLVGELPDGFRHTSIGAYHLSRWIGKFAYLDAMVFDTPIFESGVRDDISPKLGSFDIADRYERTLKFRTYLSNVWETSSLRPDYFDWNDAVKEGQVDFDTVSAAIRKIAGGRIRR